MITITEIIETAKQIYIKNPEITPDDALERAKAFYAATAKYQQPSNYDPAGVPRTVHRGFTGF
jgi:hypothetical protein